MKNPETLVVPHDPSGILEVADYLELDGLFHCGVERFYGLLRCSRGVDADTCRMIGSMSNPVRQRLLDDAMPDIFEWLRPTIPPYRHQYRSAVRKLLFDSHFARSSTLENAQSRFQTIRQCQRNVCGEMISGVLELEIFVRVEKSIFSPDGRHFATLTGCSQVLTVWDLHRQPIAPVDVYHGIIDATYSPHATLCMLGCDGCVCIYPRSASNYSVRVGRKMDRIVASTQSVLVLSSMYPWIRDHENSLHNARLWNWISGKPPQDVEVLSECLTASVSPDGSTIVYYDESGKLWTSARSSDCQGRRKLYDPDGNGRQTDGEILSLVVSDRGNVLLATYATLIRFWDLTGGGGAQGLTFDLGVAHHETVGHAALSADGRTIAVGSWEGYITLLAHSGDALVQLDRMYVGTSVLRTEGPLS